MVKNLYWAHLFGSAAQIGALVNQTELSKELALKSFGENIGIAFQIIDDILDYNAGDELGKATGEDLKECKVTLPIIHNYQHTNEEENKFWERIIQKNEHEDSDIETAVALFNKYKTFEYCKDIALKYLNDAYQTLEMFNDCTEKQLLNDIIKFSKDRIY